MELLSLSATHFRNLARRPVEWVPHRNLILGPNGEGKTNLLEAVAVLGNMRSFRTANPRRLASHGSAGFVLEGVAREDGFETRLRQVVDLGPPIRRALFIDDRGVPAETYLQQLPLVAMSSADHELVSGEPRVRRAFLDRFAFLVEPAVYDELRAYRRSLRQRNAALEDSTPDEVLDAWERSLATTAARVVHRRRLALAKLREVFVDHYPSIASPGFPNIELDYRGEAWLRDLVEPREVEETYVQRYNENRARDRQAGYTQEGPHRHDLSLRANGRSVRDVLSSGQTKVVAAALRLAMLTRVERERGRTLPVIIDDADAELDRSTLARFIRSLGVDRQVFLSSAHDEFVVGVFADSARFHMETGLCRRGSGD